MAELVVAAGSRQPAPLAPVRRPPDALPSAGRPNRPSIHYLERGSPMGNRKREICTSGSARDEDGQPPHLLGPRHFLHLAAGAAASRPYRPRPHLGRARCPRSHRLSDAQADGPSPITGCDPESRHRPAVALRSLAPSPAVAPAPAASRIATPVISQAGRGTPGPQATAGAWPR